MQEVAIKNRIQKMKKLGPSFSPNGVFVLTFACLSPRAHSFSYQFELYDFLQQLHPAVFVFEAVP